MAKQRGLKRIFPHGRVLAALATALLGASLSGPALGQSGSWNVDADGTWSTTSNWLGGTVATGNTNTATFANNITVNRTVTLAAGQTIGNLVFGDADTTSAAGWIVSGSTLTINNNTNSGTITVNALGTGATATISSVIAGGGSMPSIIKNGVGTLVLGGVNSFTNKLAITSGTLQVSADRNLGAVGTFATDRITISNGAALRITSADLSLSGSRGITIGSGGGTISVGASTLTINAPFTGSGNTATVTGAALILKNASGTATNVNWNFAQNSGSRTFFEGANALGTGAVTVSTGNRLTSQSMSSGTLTNAVTLQSGAGLTARATGESQTYTNVVFPTSGSVVFNRDDNATSNLTITSSGSLTGNLTVETSQGGAFAVSDVFLDGVFSGAGGLVKSGTGASGRLVLRGANTYTGTTTITAGTLVASSSNSLPGFESSGRVVFNGGTLQIPVNGTSWTMAQADTILTNATKTSGALAIEVATGTQTQTGSGYSGGVGLTKLGSGALTFVAGNAYTGTTSIDNGTLQLGNGGTVGSLSASSTITGSAGGTLVFNRSDTISSGTHFNSAIGGAIGVTQVGSGTVVLAGANTYTGKTSITNGTLAIGNATSLGANPGSFTADQLTISNSATLRTTAAITLSANRGITIGTGTATISVNGGSLTAGRFTGSGNTVTVTGSNALTLQNTSGTATNVNWDFSPNSGVRTFFEGANALGTGSVRVRSGKLTSQSMTTGTLTNAVTLDSGAGLTARSSGGAQTYTNVTLPASGSVLLNNDDLATSALTILSGGTLTGTLTVSTQQGGANAVGDVTLSGVLSGAGGLIKTGTGSSGILVLGTANTYTGNTTISTGTLKLGVAGSIANSGTISVASGAWFDTSLVPSGFSVAATQWLMGSGTVLGNVSSLGTIAPGLSGSAGTLSFASNLSLDSGSILSYGLSGTNTTAGGGINDLSAVIGNLSLDGTLNVSEIGVGSFLSATQGDTWRLFTYSGTLTDNGLSLGTVPTLFSGLTLAVDTSTANEVNLIVVPEPAVTVSAIAGIGLLALLQARLKRKKNLAIRDGCRLNEQR